VRLLLTPREEEGVLRIREAGVGVRLEIGAVRRIVPDPAPERQDLASREDLEVLDAEPEPMGVVELEALVEDAGGFPLEPRRLPLLEEVRELDEVVLKGQRPRGSGAKREADCERVGDL